MFLVNTDYISGKTLETLGFVSGTDFVFTVISDKAIESAKQEMIKEAKKLRADAVINIRYVPATNHVYISGTAVKFV